MKRGFIVVCMLVVSLLQPVVVLAGGQDELSPPEKAQQKDMCALYASQCGTTVQSLQDKITRLQEAIAKGTRVYTVEELLLLKEKLEEANRRLDLFFDR